MKGLLYKDFLMAWKYCKLYLVIAVIFLALFFFVTDYWFFFIYPGILFGMIPVNLLAYDEHSRWKIFGLTLPFSRAQLVSVKYLMGLLPVTAFTVFGSVAFGIVKLARNSFSWSDIGFFAFGVFFFPLLCSMISLPISFRFGVEKGRTISLFIVGGACGISVVYNVFLKDYFTVSMPSITLTILVIVGVIILALYALSWKLSIMFYQKR
ncbi:MAG: ABC-2 transporter permease [Clostridia bacterium]|nr:ABC-2 transporter permease [Clostridia bacterium]